MLNNLNTSVIAKILLEQDATMISQHHLQPLWQRIIRRATLLGATEGTSTCPAGCCFDDCEPPPLARTLALTQASTATSTTLNAASENITRDSDTCLTTYHDPTHAACLAGRRPQGLRSTGQLAQGHVLGRWFAEMAHMEAAAVVAFENLASELAAHGAPQALIAGCHQAALDERVHAEMARAQARRWGCEARVVDAPHLTLRSLETLALDNATEGCTFETFAALEAGWQSHAASDPAIRRMMARISADETRHAELSWAIDAWLRQQLDDATWARVEDARRAAAQRLVYTAMLYRDPLLVDIAGLPEGETRAALVNELDTHLWRHAA